MKLLFLLTALILAAVSQLDHVGNRKQLAWSVAPSEGFTFLNPLSVLPSISNSILHMKAKFGAIVVDGRGKIGGHVASKNRSGSYFRTKVTPVNAQTSFQNAVRSRLASFSAAWRSLTQAQRDAWDAAVANFSKTNIFGDIVNPTGKNLYTALNGNLSNIGEAAISVPPTPVAVIESAIDTITYADPTTAANVEIELDAVDANQSYLVFASAPTSPGVGFFKNRLRQIMVHAGSTGTTIDATAAYVAKFGNPIAGQKAGFKVVPVDQTTGQSGVGASDYAIATVS